MIEVSMLGLRQYLQSDLEMDIVESREHLDLLTNKFIDERKEIIVPEKTVFDGPGRSRKRSDAVRLSGLPPQYSCVRGARVFCCFDISISLFVSQCFCYFCTRLINVVLTTKQL